MTSDVAKAHAKVAELVLDYAKSRDPSDPQRRALGNIMLFHIREALGNIIREAATSGGAECVTDPKQ